jgi:hypothetical protein
VRQKTWVKNLASGILYDERLPPPRVNLTRSAVVKRFAA